ncbi:MAG: amidohydrolase family protein [Deltaproteobacteria bacterium]|nr:amidohydrolase family protein [Deltaproteobacteria bacterium]
MTARRASAPRGFRAAWLWAGPGRLWAGRTVILENGRVAAVEENPPAGMPVEDLGEALILPGLVNAHTHVELSGLAGLATPRGDFLAWLEELVASRPAQNKERSHHLTARAAQEMAGAGVALVGDITNTGLARPALWDAGLSQVSLYEALGAANAEPPAPELTWRDGRLTAGAIAAHAPYSVPGWRIQDLKERSRAGLGVFCLHLAESRAEVEFLRGEGEEGRRLARFLAARGVERRELGLRSPDGLRHLLALGVLDDRTLVVHGVQLTSPDLALLAATGASLCVCPRSNLGLTRAVAPVEEALARGMNLCLGTDSLASAPDLNLWREMAALAELKPELAPEAILTMATVGGARALGLAESFGQVAPGRPAALAWTPLPPGLAPDQVLAQAVSGGQGYALPGDG